MYINILMLFMVKIILAQLIFEIIITFILKIFHENLIFKQLSTIVYVSVSIGYNVIEIPAGVH